MKLNTKENLTYLNSSCEDFPGKEEDSKAILLAVLEERGLQAWEAKLEESSKRTVITFHFLL